MIIDIPTVEGDVFIDGGPNTLGTIVRASFLNSLMKSSTATTKEIQTILTKNGIQPDDRVHDQLFKAISKMITDGKVALTDVLGTSKMLAASQFLVNEVNKLALLAKEKSELVGIQANNNAKEIEKKLGAGDFGLGGRAILIDTGKTVLEELKDSTGFFVNNADKSVHMNAYGIMLKHSLGYNWFLTSYIGDASDIRSRVMTKTGYNFEVTLYNSGNTFKDKSGFLRDKSNKLDALTTDDLNDTVTSTSTIQAATANAVKLAYDKAVEASQVHVDRIFYFDSATPPSGFIARNGQAIDKAKMPKLFAKYGAKMPDDRDRVHRMTGTLAGAVGTTQEDAIRNITGEIGTTIIYDGISSGAFIVKPPSGITNRTGAVGSSNKNIGFDASLVVPTAAENRVKSRIILACNKIQ